MILVLLILRRPTENYSHRVNDNKFCFHSHNVQTSNHSIDFFIYILLQDESQSTSPDDGGIEASPRINRFLARLPPDGCEKVKTIIQIINISLEYL